MRLRKLSNGTQICPEIRLDSLLDTHNGIALYLAYDREHGHALVHILPDFEGDALKKLEQATAFHTEVLGDTARCGRYEEFLFFSEPFPLGEFMFEWLERRGRVSLPEALKYTIRLLKVLSQAREKGISHGRITPKHILMERTGHTVELRLMGLGVASAMTDSMQCDIDWFDYTFDLEGMSPVAVDVYGMAIILMGLVSGESGIDSFEATGLLPPMFRGGSLQQAMEKALALRMDAYTDILPFSLDLEAAMLEIDDKRGEVYVGDLVGFESAVKSISSVSDESSITEGSGIWNSLFDTLEQEERSSLLYSLTSLPAIKPLDDEDEDVTRITSMPSPVLGSRRIRSAHSDKTNITSTPESEQNDTTSVSPKPQNHDISDLEDIEDIDRPEADKTEIIRRPLLATLEDAHRAEVQKTETTPTENPSQPQLTSTAQRLADIQSLESELEDNEEEDDAPTRVMMRPNYFSIQFGQENQGVDSSIEEVIQDDEPAANSIAGMTKRIQSANVEEYTFEIPKDVIYDLNDPVAFPPEDEIIPKLSDSANHLNHPNTQARQQISAAKHHTEHRKKPQFTDKQRKIIIVLLVCIAVLFVIAIYAAVSKSHHIDITEVEQTEETLETSTKDADSTEVKTENNDAQQDAAPNDAAQEEDDFVIGEPLAE